jgi:hypothetical protein
MDNSPKGREIRWIEGSPDSIASRGSQIVSLGDQMVNSAAILKSIADGASGMKGLSVDKIREVTGDVHEQLKLAGERYSPTGRVLGDYATALREVQSGLQTIIDDCVTYWSRYEDSQADFRAASREADKTVFVLVPDPAAPDPQDKVDDAARDVNHARDLWQGEAERYDARYDTWEQAFDDATERIGTATEGGISDRWTDDFNLWAEGALTVLGYIGLVLGILCLFIGSPFLALAAAIVGLVALALTIILALQGRRSGEDVAWAVIGVIPFGRLGTLFKGTNGVSTFFRGFVGLPAAGKSGAVAELNTAVKALRAGFTFAPQGTSRLGSAISTWGNGVRYQAGGPSGVLARWFNVSDMSKVLTGEDAINIIFGHASRIKTIIRSWIPAAAKAILPPPVTDIDRWRTQLAG